MSYSHSFLKQTHSHNIHHHPQQQPLVNKQKYTKSKYMSVSFSGAQNSQTNLANSSNNYNNVTTTSKENNLQLNLRNNNPQNTSIKIGSDREIDTTTTTTKKEKSCLKEVGSNTKLVEKSSAVSKKNCPKDLSSSQQQIPTANFYALCQPSSSNVFTQPSISFPVEREWVNFSSSVRERPQNCSISNTLSPNVQIASKSKCYQLSLGFQRNHITNQKISTSPRDFTNNENNKEIYYQCGNCQYELFSATNIFYHQDPKNEKILCNSHFIEKMPWMKFDAKASIFKQNCAGCNKVIGDAKVSGLMCSCGYWQHPAFKIYKNRTEGFTKGKSLSTNDIDATDNRINQLLKNK